MPTNPNGAAKSLAQDSIRSDPGLRTHADLIAVVDGKLEHGANPHTSKPVPTVSCVLL